MKKILKLLIDKNPIFGLCLGLCSALAITTTFENSYLMGISVLLVLILSNIVVSLIARFVPTKIRIPVYITVIAIFVTLLDYSLMRFIPELSTSLGVYIPLIIVNCLVLGRALAYASRHKVKASIKDALVMGLGYTLSISLIGLIREVLGNNTITIMDKISNITGYVSKYEIFPKNDIIPNVLFQTPAGALLIMGLILGIFTALKGDEK